jgi:aminoglycoside phosphotransferase (APT) family kinase protein
MRLRETARRRRRHWQTLDVAARQVFRDVFPDLPLDAPLRSRRLRPAGWHDIVSVEEARQPGRRLVLKALPPSDHDTPRQNQRRVPMLAAEYRLLSEIAPRIAAQNPATRCPRALAYRPSPGLLALEAVRGPTLDHVLFGLAPTRERRRVRHLLELCGEWLARFHQLTRTREEGNPFEWVLEAFSQPAVGAIFERCGARATQRDLCEVTRALCSAFPGFRTPRCAIHGVFAPYHILVSEGRIYVLDLESSRAGYPYEDLALFQAYYDFRLPWHTSLASTRLPIGEHLPALRDGYARHAPWFREPDELMLRLARLHALIRFPLEWRYVVERHPVKSVLRWRWWSGRFQSAYAEELPILRQAVGR